MASGTSPAPTLSPLSLRQRLVEGDLIPLLVLALAVFIFFAPVILGQVWIPAGGGDLVSFIFPMYRFAAASLRAGEIPFWNPYLYAGAPFLADNQSGVFYPANLLLFLLKPDFSYGAIMALVIGHVYLAGLTMYLCLRWLQPDEPIGRAAALFGGLVFMFSGVFITHLGNLNLIAVAAWLPLIFISLHRAILAADRRERIGWTLAAGVSLGISSLAGHGQMTFLIATLLGCYALYQASIGRHPVALLVLLAVALLGIAAAALSLIPALGGINETVRTDFAQAGAAGYSLPWRGLVGLIAPDFYGRGIHRFWGWWSRVEYGYAGVLPWLLAAVALAARPRRQTLFFVLAGLLFLLLALGTYAPPYQLLLRVLPLFPFQAPARFVLLLDFCLAVLASMGFSSLYRGEFHQGRIRRLMIGAAVVGLILAALLIGQRASLADAPVERRDQMQTAILVYGALALAGWLLVMARVQGRLPARSFAILAIGLIAFDVIGLGRNVELERQDPTLGFAENSAALAYLQADPGIHRIDIATGAWQPSFPEMAGQYSIGGVFNPLQLSNYAAYLGSVGYRGSTQYNLLGVKYVVGRKDEPPGDTNILMSVFNEDPQVDVYLNTQAYPRVMLVYNAQVVADAEAAFTAIHDEAFEPAQYVILESGQPLSQESGLGEITIQRYDLNQAAFWVKSDRPAYLLLTDIDHPDWSATVDGVEAPLLTADYAFRAIYLEAGEHTVAMTYTPAGWWPGLGLSLAAWLGIVAGIIWLVRSRIRNNRAQPDPSLISGILPFS